jgi:hypothetical protein
MSVAPSQRVISNEDQCYIAIITQFGLDMKNTCQESMTAYDVVHWHSDKKETKEDISDEMNVMKYFDATAKYDANYWVDMDNKIIGNLESAKPPVKTLSEQLKSVQNAFKAAQRTTIHPSSFLVNSDDDDDFS